MSMAMRGILNSGENPFKEDPNYKYVMDAKPDAIVLMIGSNDSKAHQWKGQQAFEKDFLSFGGELIKALDGHKEHLYVMQPPPAVDIQNWPPFIEEPNLCIFNRDIVNNLFPKIFPPLTEQLGLNLTTNYIDAFKPLGGAKERKDLFCIQNDSSFKCDNCHPNEEAHRILADLMWDKIHYQVSKFKQEEVDMKPKKGLFDKKFMLDSEMK